MKARSVGQQMALYWLLLVLVPPVASVLLFIVTPFALMAMAWYCLVCWIDERKASDRSGGMPC